MINPSIPMPAGGRTAFSVGFNWTTMNIGDSADIDTKLANSLRAQFHRKRWGLITRVHGTDEFPLAEGKTRVWRGPDMGQVVADALVTPATEVSNG